MKIESYTQPLVIAQQEASPTKHAIAGAPNVAALPEPLDSMTMSDDVIAQITALLAKGYREDRKEAKKLANIEQQVHAREVAKRVRELHAKADATLSSAVVSGVTGMVAGAAQLAGSTSSLWTRSTCPDGLSMETRMQTQWRAEDLASGVLQGGGSVTKASGDLGAGVYKAEGEHCEARAARHEGNAEAAKRRASQYLDESEDAKRMLQKVAEFLKDLRTAQQSAATAALYKA